jgi:hypothetical protein
MVIRSVFKNAPQRLCLRSGGTLKRFTVPRDQTLNEDSTLNLHVTPPLRKHFVGGWFYNTPIPIRMSAISFAFL